jgi:molybdate transport repressor ModE-like protein
MLDLRRLQILSAVARTGSFAAAARELAYSTPAVWQQMQRLEQEASAPLIERHARGVRLTPAGAALADHADALLARVGVAEAEVRRLVGAELRVASFTSATAALLPSATARFGDTHPAVRVVLDDIEPDAALRRLRSGDADLAVVFFHGPPGPEWDAVALRHLVDEPLLAIAPPGHALATEPGPVSIGRLARERWLRGRHSPPLAAVGVAAARAPRVAYGGQDYAAVKRLVAAGAGVAVVPRLALDPVPPGVVVRPLEAAAGRRRVAVARPSGRPPSAPAEHFAALLAEAAGALAGAERVAS